MLKGEMTQRSIVCTIHYNHRVQSPQREAATSSPDYSKPSPQAGRQFRRHPDDQGTPGAGGYLSPMDHALPPYPEVPKKAGHSGLAAGMLMRGPSGRE